MGCLLLGSTTFAQQGTGQDSTIAASELAKDNLERVAASEAQITAVLTANPWLVVELKRWAARDAADRGQIARDSDLTDAALLSRLANDSRFRAAATRLLQSYGYLLPKINPDSEVGRQQAALEQERIRELVAAQQAQAQQAQQSQLAKCNPSSDSVDSNCQTRQKQPQKAIQTNSPNPAELPRDRDFDQLLTNPVPQPISGNGSLLRTSANPLEGGSAAGLQATNSGDLALLPISYDRTAVPDPDAPPQLSPATAASAGGAMKRSGPGGEALLETATPAADRHWSPYSDIPSVYDMFSHAGSSSASVGRFGEEVFENPPAATGTIPIDFPASPDYVLGPGDGLTIDLWGGVSQRLVRTVDHEGRIALPEIGPMLVNGQSLGDVQQFVQAIDMAGGILPTAALSHIEVQRLDAHEKRTMLSLDVSGTTDASEIEAKLAAFQVQDRDEIHIFPIATFNQDAVYLQGHVLRAGRYAYQPGMRLTDLISSYGDLLPEPSTKYAEIIHLNPPDYHPTVESFDLAAALSDSAVSPPLKPLDTVRIFSRFDFEDALAVSVSGAVRHPGTFQTSGQVHLRDAVELAGGVTPDAAMDSAQLIRIMPDSSLKMVSVRLGEALAGDPNSNILLEPRDRIVIQQNIFHADTPSVEIAGEVLKPGRYPLSGNLRVSDLIQLAGGFKRSAYTETADLTRFDPKAGESKLGEHIEVSIPAALTSDLSKDPALRDGDVLTIRQLSGWNDIGASINLQGEVEHPGSYGIKPGERLSSVLKRAGGFAPQAYVYGAVFTRPEVLQMEQKSRNELVQRIRGEEAELAPMPSDDADKKMTKQTGMEQLETTLGRLQETPPSGRTVIRISSNLKQWEG